MRKAQFFYLLRRGLLSGGLNFIKEGLVMASKFTTQGLSFPAQGSAEFNGSSDYIQTNNAFSHTKHTIAAWVYPNGSGTRQIFDARDAASDGINIQFTSSNTIAYGVNTTDVIPNDTFSDWFYLSVTYNGSTARVYANGSEIGSASSSQTISTTNDAVIGSRSYSTKTNYFNGNFANFAIWNRALSSDEINSVMWKSYEALSGAESNGLQAWYSLDDISSPAASLANMEQLATDKNATIENKAAITAAINALS